MVHSYPPSRLWRRPLLRLLPAVLIAVGFAQVALPQHTAQASTTHPSTPARPIFPDQSPPNATNVDVLLLHGLEGFANPKYYTATSTPAGANCTNPTNDSTMTFDRWDGFYQINRTGFADISFSSNLIHPLKYFIWDKNCGPGLPNGSDDGDIGNDAHCNSYFFDTGTLETNDEDIRHIACRFYWFVYNNYTSKGKYVHILAHSMGGIITKWALSEAGKDSTSFPYPLLVYNVVTLSTPFQGIPTNFLGRFNHAAAGIACDQCFDALQLEYDGPGNPIPEHSIIPALNAFTSTEGYWTVIGSKGQVPVLTEFLSPWTALVNASVPTCDLVNIDSSLTADDTVVDPGPSLASAQLIDYDQCIFHEEDFPGAYARFTIDGLTVSSTSYQDDASTYKDYSGWVGAPGNTSYTYRTLPHALAKALEALGVTRGPNTYPYLSQMPYTYAATNADGRLEVFARGSDGNIWHIWQTCPNCGWSSWHALQSGYTFNGDPAVGQDEDGRLEVFARGTNNAILVNTQKLSGNVVTGNWNSWQTLSQAYAFQGTPMAFRNADGRLEVFAHGSDGNIWHDWETAPNSTSWNGWVRLQSGYSFKGDPVVGMNNSTNISGTLEVFALGSDGNIWHNWQVVPNSSWHGWTPLQSGKSFLGRLSVGRNADGRLEVYALDWNNNVVHNFQLTTGGWNGWVALQSQPAYLFNSTPAVGNNGDGRLEVFATENGSAAIWHDWQKQPNSSWNGWANLQSGYGFLGASPATAQNYDGRLEVFAHGSDHNLWHIWQTSLNCCWSHWGPLQSGYNFAPSDCFTTPSDQMCDNDAAVNEKCPDTSQLETASNPYVSVTLHWSATCQTKWTSAQILYSPYSLYEVDIERQSTTSDGALTYTYYPGTATWSGNMVWSPNNPARSCVWYFDPTYARVYGPVCTGWH